MIGGNDFKFHVYSFSVLFRVKNDIKLQVEQIRVQDVTKSLFSKLELYVFNSPVRTIFYDKNFLVIGSEMGQIRVFKQLNTQNEALNGNLKKNTDSSQDYMIKNYSQRKESSNLVSNFNVIAGGTNPTTYQY